MLIIKVINKIHQSINFQRSALTSQTISDDLFEEKRKFDKVVKHNDGQPPLKIANTGRNRVRKIHK